MNKIIRHKSKRINAYSKKYHFRVKTTSTIPEVEVINTNIDSIKIFPVKKINAQKIRMEKLIVENESVFSLI